MLDEQPTLHRASGAGDAASGLRGVRAPSGSAARLRLPSEATDDTAEQAGAGCPGSGAVPLDPKILQALREINARFQLRPAWSAHSVRVASGERRAQPYRRRSDELDVDRTLEVLLENPHPASEDLIVSETEVTRREVVLVIDISGSMRGERAHMAAATVGALASQLRDDELALIAFWSDAALLKRLGDQRQPLELVTDMLSLRAQGLTNVAFPLQVAATEFSGDTGSERRVVLLSDCVHNAGPDPRGFAGSPARLDVLFDSEGESDLEMAHDLARIGRGLLREVRSPRDVAEALTAIFEV